MLAIWTILNVQLALIVSGRLPPLTNSVIYVLDNSVFNAQLMEYVVHMISVQMLVSLLTFKEQLVSVVMLQIV